MLIPRKERSDGGTAGVLACSWVLAAALGLVTTEVRADNTDADPASLAEAVTWLDAEANRIIRASRREMKDGTAAFPPQVGIGYEAFWLRDYEYTLEGSVDAYSDKELLDACRLLSRSLRGDSRRGLRKVRRHSDLLQTAGRNNDAQRWLEEGQACEASIRTVFWDSHVGLFRAATERCREHDIWGSAFAVYLGVADVGQSVALANYFKNHYKAIVQYGQIRHLPGGVYWEKGCKRDVSERRLLGHADRLVCLHARSGRSFPCRSDGDRPGTPLSPVRACEWIFGDTRKLPNYLASASLPLAGIRAMLERRQGRKGRRATDTGAPTFNLPRVGTLSQQIWDSSIVLGVERIQCSRTPDSTCGDHDIGIYQIHRLGPSSLFGLLS